MRVGFIPFDEDIGNPASRMRGFDVVRGLRAAGVQAEVISPSQARGFDVVVLGNYALNLAGFWRQFAADLQSRGTRIVVDFADDLDRLRRQPLQGVPLSQRLEVWLEMRFAAGTLGDLLRRADFVTVSAVPLLRIARRYNENSAVAPDVIAPEFFAFRKEHREHRPVTIVWTGYVDNIPYLEEVEGALERLSRRYPIELRVITSTHRRTPYRDTEDNRAIVAGYDFPARFVEWRLDNAWSELFAGDIGIAPVPRGIAKSANKAATYMALGLPVVVSRTEDYQQAVQQGKTGFLCSTSQEWEAALEQLVFSTKARAEMGAQARSAAEQRYSMAAVAAEWQRIFTRIGK